MYLSDFPDIPNGKNKLIRAACNLCRCGIPMALPTYGMAGIMAADGWTVEKLTSAEIEDVNKYTRDSELSKVWIKNANELLSAMGREQK